ncbi:MAG: hypothetical protein ACP5HQ_01140 [Thermoprotei archaeon]
MERRKAVLKGQSEFIGLLVITLIIMIVLTPLVVSLLNYPQQQVVYYRVKLAQVAGSQVNAGSVLIYYNSTLKSPMLIVLKKANYTLTGVYYTNQGSLVNVTSYVYALNNTPTGTQVVGKLPQPLIYNFSLPSAVFNRPLTLQINANDVTFFVNVFPNQTAYTF